MLSHRQQKFFKFLSPEQYKLILNSLTIETGLLQDLAHIVQLYYLCKEEIYNTINSWLAVQYTGQVFVYGSYHSGGNAKMFQSQLNQGIECVYTTLKTFLVLLTNGEYISWRDTKIDISHIVERLQIGVRKILTTDNSFCAHLNDRSIISWGEDGKIFGDVLIDVDDIFCTESTFFALKKGNLLVCGNDLIYGYSVDRFIDVVCVSTTNRAICVLKQDKTIITCGPEQWGGDSTIIFLDGERVEKVVGSNSSFCAKTTHNRLIFWGCLSDIATPYSVTKCMIEDGFEYIKEIYSNKVGFCAETNIGMVTWIFGKNIVSEVKQDIKDIKEIKSSYCAYATLMKNGMVVTWGGLTGGDSREVSQYIQSGVKNIFSYNWGFRAEMQSGGSVAWGDYPLIAVN